MTTYYLDSSALSKRYVAEIGTAWIQSLAKSEAEHLLITSRITMIEVYSALARRRRAGSVSAVDCDVAEQAFTAHSATAYDFVELNLDIVVLARELLRRQSLRAYDAVQLASALTVNQSLKAANLTPLIFISADDRLNAAATNEGLVVDNPNLHP